MLCARSGRDVSDIRLSKSIAKTKSDPWWALLPEVWFLIRPRRGLLAVGFCVMVVNRVAGLVLPASSKFLIDDIIGKRHLQLLVPLVLAVQPGVAGDAWFHWCWRCSARRWCRGFLLTP